MYFDYNYEPSLVTVTLTLMIANQSFCMTMTLMKNSYLSTIQFTSIKFIKIIIWGGYGQTGKWIQENIIWLRFCCCFKLSKKTEKLSNEQPMNAITKCTLAGLVQCAKKSHQKWDLKSCMSSTQHCFFLPLPHVPVGIQNAAATTGSTS